MVSVKPAGEGSYTATSTATGLDPEIMKQIAEKMRGRPIIPKFKMDEYWSKSRPDEEKGEDTEKGEDAENEDDEEDKT